MASFTIHKSSGEKAGPFPRLLLEILRYLGHQESPLYKGFREEVNGREEWRVEVLIDTQKQKPLIFEAYCRRSTFKIGIRDAALQAIYRLRDMYADELSDSPYRYYLRRRICNTNKTICRRYNDKHPQHGPQLVQQIELTKALVEDYDAALDELRETQFKLREREEELEDLRGHKASSVASPPPPPHPPLVNGNEGVSSGGPCSAISDALPRARQSQGDPRSVVAVGTTGAARSSLQSKPTPPTRGRASAPRGHRRRLARGSNVVNENSVSMGAGGSSIVIGAGVLPQGQGDRPRPPSTQLSFVKHHVAVVEAQAPRRDRTPVSSSSPYHEGRVRGKDLVSIISDGGVGLGKEPANAKLPTTMAMLLPHQHLAALQGGAACCNAKQY